MTQNERWLLRYNEVKTFIEANKRRPSKYVMTEERGDGFSDLKVQSVAVQSCFTNNRSHQ